MWSRKFIMQLVAHLKSVQLLNPGYPAAQNTGHKHG